MRFRIRSLLIATFLIAFAAAVGVTWLRRPVAGRTLDGERFELTGHAALLHCVMTNDADSLRRLLMIDRYDLEAQTAGGQWSLLQHSLHRRNIETAALLLENGADPNFAAEGTPTPMKLAERAGQPELVALLKSYGAH